VLLSNEQTLQAHAVQYYRQIKGSTLADPLKTALIEIFVSWLEQRFTHMSKNEIEAMFVGELPDLEETQSGKDLIEIGEKRGEARGEARGKASGVAEEIVMFLEARRQGAVPEATQRRLGALPLPRLHELLREVSQGLTLEQVEAWVAAHGSPAGQQS
jgi:predicted transposase YdaD